jgi:hypothetical protein
MYTANHSFWLAPSLACCGPTVHSPTLRYLWVGGTLACVIQELESVYRVPFFSCDAALKLGVSSQGDMQGEFLLFS